MTRIDAHIHFGGDESDSLAFLRDLDLRILNICWVDDPGSGWRTKAESYRRLAQAYPHRYAWCTSFDLPRFEDPAYINDVINGLDRDFEDCAVACKVWKNLGMELRKPCGEFFMVDDPLLDPIFEYLADRDKTLLAHIAEPRACWEPLQPGTPHYGYYSQHPQWHMFGKPDMPSHAELIEARDHVIEKHPNLRVIAAHLGSLEYDVAELAERFDRYPNFAVDMSARLLDLTYQDRQAVRQWCINYQDRILFGTDLVTRTVCSAMPVETRGALLNEFRQWYDWHDRYLAGSGTFDLQGRQVTGLGLPPEVLEKIYFRNAVSWYPELQRRFQ